MKDFIRELDQEAIQNAQSYVDVRDILIRVLKRMPTPIIMISGPISTGGVGSMEGNIKKLQEEINKAKIKGVSVFEPSLFAELIERVIQVEEPGVDYSMKMLSTIFLPIYEAGLIAEIHFLPDWQSSTGATWEHEQAERLEIDIEYLA